MNEKIHSVRLPEVETRALENGLNVLVVRDRRLPLVSVLLMLKKGAETDEEGRAGRADLLVEMLTLGTKNRSGQRLALDVDSLGARLAVYSGWDASFLEIEGLSSDLAALVEILSDMVVHPTFPRPEFEQLKERRIANLIQDLDASDSVADVQFTELAFQGTPYGHPRCGIVDSVKRISLEDLYTFHGQHFMADQCVLMMAGHVDPEQAFRTAAEFFGPLGRGADRPVPDAFPIPYKEERQVRIIHRADLTQSQIRMGHPGIRRASDDYHRFQVANYILGGGGFSSRLMDRIRSRRGYTYGISSSFRGRRSPGPFCISTFTPNDTTFPVVLEILEVLDQFLREGVTAKELEEAKNFYLGSYPFRFETPRKIAREVLDIELYGLSFQALSEYPEKISGAAQSDVETVARRRVLPDRLSIVIVGNSEAFAKEMDKVAAVEFIDFQSLVPQR